MKIKREEALKIISQDKKEDDVLDRQIRFYLYKDVKDKRRDKMILIFFNIYGLMFVTLSDRPIVMALGVVMMFISAILSILVWVVEKKQPHTTKADINYYMKSLYQEN